MIGMSSTLSEISEYNEAESLLKQALNIYQGLYSDDNFNVLRVMANMGALLAKSGDYIASEMFLKRTLQGFNKIYDGDHANIVLVMNNLAMTQVLSKQYNAARQTVEKSLAMETRLNSDSSTVIAEILITSSILHIKLGHYTQAQQIAEQARELYTQNLQPGHWRIAMANNVLAAALTGLQQYAEAESLLLTSSPIVLKEKGKDTYINNQVIERFIHLYTQLDNPERIAYYTSQLSKPQ